MMIGSLLSLVNSLKEEGIASVSLGGLRQHFNGSGSYSKSGMNLNHGVGCSPYPKSLSSSVSPQSASGSHEVHITGVNLSPRTT